MSEVRSLKDIFLAKKGLVQRASAAVSSDWWAEFVGYTVAHLVKTRDLTKENIDGMKILEEGLKYMVAPDPGPARRLSSGLHHDLSIDPSKRKGTQNQDKKGE